MTCCIAHAQLKPRIGPIFYSLCVCSNFLFHITLFRKAQFLLYSAYVQCIFSDLKMSKNIRLYIKYYINFIFNISSLLLYLRGSWTTCQHSTVLYKVKWDKHCTCGTTLIISSHVYVHLANLNSTFVLLSVLFFCLCQLRGGLVVSLTA